MIFFSYCSFVKLMTFLGNIEEIVWQRGRLVMGDKNFYQVFLAFYQKIEQLMTTNFGCYLFKMCRWQFCVLRIAGGRVIITRVSVSSDMTFSNWNSAGKNIRLRRLWLDIWIFIHTIFSLFAATLIWRKMRKLAHKYDGSFSTLTFLSHHQVNREPFPMKDNRHIRVRQNSVLVPFEEIYTYWKEIQKNPTRT